MNSFYPQFKNSQSLLHRAIYLSYEMENCHSRKLCQHKLLKQMFDCSAIK